MATANVRCQQEDLCPFVPNSRKNVCASPTCGARNPFPTKLLMSHEPRALSLEEISARIRDAAASESWRPGHHLGSVPVSLPETCDIHFSRIQASLHRASTKTFVRAIKPFRRILRNQGAVNDSLIEAVHHLAAQNQKMMEQMNKLRELVSKLRSETRQPERPTMPKGRTGERRKIPAGKEVGSNERSSSPVAEDSDRNGSCE